MPLAVTNAHIIKNTCQQQAAYCSRSVPLSVIYQVFLQTEHRYFMAVSDCAISFMPLIGCQRKNTVPAMSPPPNTMLASQVREGDKWLTIPQARRMVISNGDRHRPPYPRQTGPHSNRSCAGWRCVTVACCLPQIERKICRTKSLYIGRRKISSCRFD